MIDLSVLTSSITEPVTHDEVKTFMGFPAADTSQDSLLDGMITAARQWLEGRTALSLVSKSYKAYFEREDSEDGWFELPVSPVLAAPAITVAVNGVDTTFDQKGLNIVKVFPSTVIGTLPVGSTSFDSYCEVVFQAGETNTQANEILKELVSIAFNYREDGIGVSVGRIPYSLTQRIDSISRNV
jgi:uncharacterized phiE125 gp8 family phage protein